MPDPRPQPHATSVTGATRLDFLDALRGIAALTVACGHIGEGTIPGFRGFDDDVFRLGLFGVAVFFLCSGFIIPASLERHGRLAPFWISRAFRLFPLYWAALALALVLHAAGTYELPPAYEADMLTSTLANATMMQAFADQPLAIGLSWTLAWEMAFYLIVSGLFLVGVHRRSIPLATILASMSLGLALHTAGEPVLLSAAALVPALIAGLAIVVRLDPRMIAGLAVVAVLSVPLLLNGYASGWRSVALFALMFTGTAMYRWLHGEVDGRRVAALAAGAAAAIAVAAALAAGRPAEVPTFLAAFALFGGGLLLRERRVPRVLARLGVISYSIYLLHPLVFALVAGGFDAAWPLRAALVAATLVAIVVVAELSYRFVERPMIDRGHALARRHRSRGAVAMPRAAEPRTAP